MSAGCLRQIPLTQRTISGPFCCRRSTIGDGTTAWPMGQAFKESIGGSQASGSRSCGIMLRWQLQILKSTKLLKPTATLGLTMRIPGMCTGSCTQLLRRTPHCLLRSSIWGVRVLLSPWCYNFQISPGLTSVKDPALASMCLAL